MAKFGARLAEGLVIRVIRFPRRPTGNLTRPTVFGRWLHLATCLSGETQLLSGAQVYSNCFARFIPH